jgi:hypothetical protein
MFPMADRRRRRAEAAIALVSRLQGSHPCRSRAARTRPARRRRTGPGGLPWLGPMRSAGCSLPRLRGRGGDLAQRTTGRAAHRGQPGPDPCTKTSGWRPAPARYTLGEAAYNAVLRRGAAMDEDEVVWYAVSVFQRVAALLAQPGAQVPYAPPGPASLRSAWGMIPRPVSGVRGRGVAAAGSRGVVRRDFAMLRSARSW